MPRSLRSLPLGLVVLVLSVAAGCAGSEGSQDDSLPRARAPEGLVLADPAESVATVQVFPTGREGDLPILRQRRGGTLTLRFDLLGETGRPLSVYFYHADRTWRRDLVPSQYLGSFQRDDILRYDLSQAQSLRYSHYAYTFPNDDITFLVSGNYIVRVTEQGLEDEVLFERPFFISEDAGAVALDVSPVLVGGRQFANAQPAALFSPPRGFTASVFDYGTCFVRNARYTASSCTERAFLADAPNVRFELRPDDSFRAASADYLLDLTRLAPGGQVERVDLSERPYVALLQPDLVEFPDLQTPPNPNGQPLVASVVNSVAEPNIQGEYVEAQFSLAPPFDATPGSTVRLVGSFNGWNPEGAPILEWVAERERYEGSVLLKQGFYEYGYIPDDPGVRGAMRRNAPRFENVYSAFVYIQDVSLQTDRLLAVESILAR